MANNSHKIKELEQQITGLLGEIKTLHQRDDIWQKLLDTSPDAIFIADADSGRIVEANHHAEKLLGYSQDELIGLHQSQLHHPAFLDLYAEIFKEGIAAGKMSAKNIDIQRKDGEVVPVEIFASTFFRDNKKLIVGFFRDTSAIKDSQQSLAASVERYQFLFNKAYDGLTVYHPQPDGTPGTFIEVNDAACRIMGCSRDEMLRLSPIDMVMEHEWPQIAKVVEELKEKGSVVFTIQVVRNDNRIITVEIHDHLFEFEGKPTVLSIIRDISGRVEAEEKLKETQGKLIYTDKMTSLGELVAGVAHELNNTVNFITGAMPPLKRNINMLQGELRELCAGNSQLLNKEGQQKDGESIDNLFSTIEELFANVEEGARRTSSIVHDLKVFSHKKGVELVRYDLHKILETNLALLAHERVEINRDFGASNHHIYCYPDFLAQVFMNLLINALQSFPGQKQGQVWVRTWNDDEHFFVSIRDNGIGVPGEIRTKIFEPFFTTKKVGDGTGLGLSISYSLVKKHKGEIRLQSSSEQQGSEFVVSLPVDLRRLRG